MREVCFLITGDRILRCSFGTAAHIDDSRERWEAIWEHRKEITEIVHTHPGGLLRFSEEDLSTMEAVEAGTGRTFVWSIVTENGYLRREGEEDTITAEEPWWIVPLRDLSFRMRSLPRERRAGTTKTTNPPSKHHECSD